MFDKLSESRTKIVSEFTGCQGNAVDIGGYYLFDAFPTIISILDGV